MSASKGTALMFGSPSCKSACLGGLQSRRVQLNREIHREIRLRAGAENLVRATNNRAVKETASLELSFANSHLQLLREQLAELNGCLEPFDGEHSDTRLPMITLGLKETRDIDFREPFKDFILEHYSEDGDQFDDAIQAFMELRQAMRRPSKSKSGVQLLLRYLGVLYYVERRFFPADRNVGIFFEWYDTLTGVPNIQRTLAFEKASVLYNLAALHTQIGSQQERKLNSDAADGAVDNFLRAAGTLRYVGDHFTHPPSFDLDPTTLSAITALLLVQARECLFEKQQLTDKLDLSTLLKNGTIQGENQAKLLELVQEAQLLSNEYSGVSNQFSVPELKEYIPPAWSSLVQVKRDLYASLAHHYISALLLLRNCTLSQETLETFRYLYTETDNAAVTEVRTPFSPEDRRVLGFCHLRQALLSLEDAARHARLNRELRSKTGLQLTLSSMKDKILATFEQKEVKSEEELERYLDPPQILAATKLQLELSPPNFATHHIEDPFKALGPLTLFSAKRYWSPPRHVLLRRRGEGFGFSVKGSCPVSISSVDGGSPAALAGVRQGDVIVGIVGKDAKWFNHEEVVTLVRTSGDSLKLRLVTPLDVKSADQYGSHSNSERSDLPHSMSSSSSGSGNPPFPPTRPTQSNSSCSLVL